MRPEFRNEPLTDFAKAENRAAMEQAIQTVTSRFGAEHALVIGGERVTSGATFPSSNPARPSQVLGTFAKASREHIDQALEAAWAAYRTWSRETPERRADLLFRAADRMRRRKHEFSAWMIHETGKSWVEADADTAEAIDFLEFYGREALRWARPHPVTAVPGEKNELFYIPLGAGAVIPPWNFPLAILVGMTAASIVAGNTVLLKPASDSPAIATAFFELLEECGMPPGVVNFVPGSGGEIGDHLVEHPRTRFITFTGSKEVGLGIVERAGRTAPGQKWIKRVVAEMGGKDTIIVDGEADLDAAVAGVVSSAFGYQGQKCSACSRAIVDASLYDAFLEKVRARVEQIRMGDPANPDNFMGPVINAAAKKKTEAYIEIGKKEGRLLIGGCALPSEGYFVQPTVIADVDPMARISQEEIFGPVLAVIRAKDFDEALAIANNTEYGLTGSVYTKNEEKLARARDEFHVGNLYGNRKCTGALVGGHPFGGFNMSGTDSKAGGRDYLGLFLQAKSFSRTV